ncbi:MAG: serine/threonine-protein phosphatase [Bacteroidaceae bacterium]|nr:serine/threonine-protein phosphatase [Bacteroidaceae bacterium]
MRKTIITLIAAAALLFSFSACEKTENKEQTDSSTPDYSPSESLIINQGFKANDSVRTAFLIDSLQKTGDLTPMAAAIFRASYHEQFCRRSDYDIVTERLFTAAYRLAQPDDHLKWYYNFCGNRLAYYLYMGHNYEGCLRVAVPLLTTTDSLGNSPKDQTNLYSLLCCCYVKLDQPDKAEETGKKARSYCWEVLAKDSSAANHRMFINSYARIKDAYVRVKNWEKTREWMEFNDSIGRLYKRRYPDDSVWPIYDGFTHLDRAIKAWSLGLTDSAAAEYAEFRKYDCAYGLVGLTQSNDYLMPAERWEDAADNYRALDWFIANCVSEVFMEEIYSYYMPKFRANLNAGRMNEALFVAKQISDIFDSTYVRQKRSQMAEMATIYDTQGKEMEIARQKAELSHERWIGTLAALALITTFFIIYTLYRRRAGKRLQAAHAKLQQAYDQLEETTTAKERIESELRIARNIQMSMVPNVFPECDGLDMFASMVPAKEVGGDLYGYFLQGDSLYLCVGDVSGKGVPASLFMAQSARLFRTLASEGMAPADIAVRMNNELSEGNDNNMFVTMFIGLIHLDSGQFDFCNCGHNPPVIDGQFLRMTHVNQPIGIMEGLPFRGETLPDIRGHQLLIYTDGLTEAENPQKALLGDNRLIQLMADAARLSSHEVIDMLTKAVEQHRSGAEPSDDLTLMCITLKK